MDLQVQESETVHHIWGSPRPTHDDSSDTQESSGRRFDEAWMHLNNVEFHDSSEDSKSFTGDSQSHVSSVVPFPGDAERVPVNMNKPRVPGLQGGYTVGGSSSGPFLTAASSSQMVPGRNDQLAVQEPANDEWNEGDDPSGATGPDLHLSRDCKPCLYLNSKTGCLNGASCRFCHLPHAKKNRPRPCKAKRTQCKQIVGMLHTVFGEDSVEFHEASLRLSTESAYMRSILGKTPGAAMKEPGQQVNDQPGMPAIQQPGMPGIPGIPGMPIMSGQPGMPSMPGNMAGMRGMPGMTAPGPVQQCSAGQNPMGRSPMESAELGQPGMLAMPANMAGMRGMPGMAAPGPVQQASAGKNPMGRSPMESAELGARFGDGALKLLSGGALAPPVLGAAEQWGGKGGSAGVPGAQGSHLGF